MTVNQVLVCGSKIPRLILCRNKILALSNLLLKCIRPSFCGKDQAKARLCG